MFNLAQELVHLFHPHHTNRHRAKVLHPEAYLYYLLIAVGFVCLIQVWEVFTPKWGHVLGFASNITPEQVIDQTNQERSRLGLAPVKLNQTLSAAALAKGQDMFNQQYWAHQSPQGKQPWDFIHAVGYDYQAAGENLARDFADTPAMVRAWMASPTHKANIVNSKYEEIGVAVIDGELEGYKTTLVVQMFGTPRIHAAQISQGESTNLPVEWVREPSKITNAPEVLASALVPKGTLGLPPLFSPLQLSKAFFLSLVMLLIMTLVYDGYIASKSQLVRSVGKNLGHIMFLTTIAFLLILFKGGIIG